MHRAWLIATVVLFILVNTLSLWDSWLGPYSFLAFMIMASGFFILCVLTLLQILALILERFAIRGRIVNVTITTLLLITMHQFPGGIVRFDRSTDDDLLVAWREGAANCNTTFRLKEDKRFVETDVCFGVTEVSGSYELNGDTILFKDVHLGRHVKEYYEYAVIRSSESNYPSSKGDLVRFKDRQDTIGHELWIAQNYLNKD